MGASVPVIGLFPVLHRCHHVVIALRPRDKPHNNNSLMQEANVELCPPHVKHMVPAYNA